MKKAINNQHPSSFNSLLDWADTLSLEDNVATVLYSDGDFYTESTACKFDNCLIMMGKAFSNTKFLQLLCHLEELALGRIAIFKPIKIAENICVRILYENESSKIKDVMRIFSHREKLDFSLHNSLPDFSEAGLVLMDMDSTSIQIECIDEIARLYNVGDAVSKVTELAMQGKLDFNESLRTRVAKLKGAPVSLLQEVADSMAVMPGLLNFISTLKKANWKVAIASGGFRFFANRLKKDYGFDYVIANNLVIEDGYLVGEVTGEIINADVKAKTLCELSEKYQIPITQTVAIGDGANDLVMMSAASTGIAIHAKPIVQERADVSLNYMDLEGAEIILSIATLDAW